MSYKIGLIGTGKVNCFGAIEAAKAKGAERMVVEQGTKTLTYLELQLS